LMATGKYEAAIEDFNAALNVDANNSEAWTGLGVSYEKLNNRAKAVESYQRAVTVNPNASEARAALQRLG
jgi:Flp pilus assembly protein TadD